VANGADVLGRRKDTGATGLILAAQYDQAGAVKALVQRGADIETKTAAGETALMTAASNEAAQVVGLLLSKGSDVNARDGKGSTALMKAAGTTSERVVRLLLEGGADVNATDSVEGRTSLHYACCNADCSVPREGLLPTVKLLVHRGANVNAGDKKGWTPLLCAASNGCADLVAFLLTKGAQIDSALIGEEPRSLELLPTDMGTWSGCWWRAERTSTHPTSRDTHHSCAPPNEHRGRPSSSFWNEARTPT